MKPTKNATILNDSESKKSSQIFAFLPPDEMLLFFKAKSKIREELVQLGHISANENITPTKVVKVLLNTYIQLLSKSLVCVKLNSDIGEQIKLFSEKEYMDTDKFLIKAAEFYINNQKKEKKAA